MSPESHFSIFNQQLLALKQSYSLVAGCIASLCIHIIFIKFWDAILIMVMPSGNQTRHLKTPHLYTFVDQFPFQFPYIYIYLYLYMYIYYAYILYVIHVYMHRMSHCQVDYKRVRQQQNLKAVFEPLAGRCGASWMTSIWSSTAGRRKPPELHIRRWYSVGTLQPFATRFAGFASACTQASQHPQDQKMQLRGMYLSFCGNFEIL